MSDKTPTPEEIQKDFGVTKRLYNKYSAVIKGAISGIIFGGSTMLGVWEGYSKPQMYEIVDTEIEKYAIEEEKKKESFRGGLSKKWKIEKEDVVDHLCYTLDSLTTFMHEAGKYQEYLEERIKISPIEYFIDLESGEQYWRGPDLQIHRLAWEDGQCWVIYHSSRKNLKGF